PSAILIVDRPSIYDGAARVEDEDVGRVRRAERMGHCSVAIADVGAGKSVRLYRLFHVLGRDAERGIDVDEKNAFLTIRLFEAGQRGGELAADGAIGAGDCDYDGGAVFQVRELLRIAIDVGERQIGEQAA